MTGRRSERGLALVVVLWGVAALSLIAAAMLAASANSARISRNAWMQLQVQQAADTAVQTTLLSLYDPDPAGHAVLDGRSRDIGAQVTVSVQDETGRLDINLASRNQLRDYFKSAGADAQDADTLADRVVDWRSPKGTQSLNGASAEDYEGAGYRPRGAPFQSVDELQFVLGMTPALLRSAAPGLTVYSHHQDFDLRFAPKEVLALIPGMDSAKIDQAIAMRRPTPALSGHAFTIIATARHGHMEFTRRVVVLITRDPTHPYWILDWT